MTETTSVKSRRWYSELPVLLPGLFLLWALTSILYQEDVSTLWRLFLSLIVLTVPVGLVFGFIAAARGGIPSTLSFVAFWWLIAWSVFFYLLRQNRAYVISDLVAVTLAIVVVDRLQHVYVSRRTRREPPVSARTWGELAPAPLQLWTQVLFVVLFWLLASLLPHLWQQPLPRDAQRFSTLGSQRSIVADADPRWDDLRVGLSLSGGGYRAAAFHAGVLQALEDLGVVVDNLSTVSGGSMIGAYYALGGEPSAFAPAVAKGRFDLWRELATFPTSLYLVGPMRIPTTQTRLLPGLDFDRLDAQRRLLDRVLLGDADIPGGRQSEHQPRLLIAVTDLNFGFQLGLLPDGVVKIGQGRSNWNAYLGEAWQLRSDLDLVDRVAISGAFPLAFPPRPLEVDVEISSATGRGRRSLLLVDGGLRDNLGYDLLRAADRLADHLVDVDPTGTAAENFFLPDAWDLDLILVSDASAILDVLEHPVEGLALLPRLFEVASIEAETPGRDTAPCPALTEVPVTFSPGSAFLELDSRFNLEREGLSQGELRQGRPLRFHAERYPESVLARLGELLHEQEATLESPAGIGETVVSRARLEAAIGRDLEVFRSTSTLSDVLRKNDARALERLGQFLVYLNWPRLRRTLETAVSCSQPPSIPSTPPAPPPVP